MDFKIEDGSGYADYRLPEFIVPGFKAAGVVAGIKKNGRRDLALILSDVPASGAALFTTNKVKAAPVLLGIERIKKGVSRGVVVNSGNANACTGKNGMKAALAMTSCIERAIGLEKGEILVSSTGVIGVPLPYEKVEAAVPALLKGLSYKGLGPATEAIMTTDAFPKSAVREIKIGTKTLTIGGIAKGAGMICPNMATLLSYFLTDAKIKTSVLKKALKIAVDASFNSILVDNDTSTNDTSMIFANGVSGVEIKDATPGYRAFLKALTEVSVSLAQMIVRDGEGATRFLEIGVKGAGSNKDARKGARTVAESMLVKTAFFGGDPNWGRILAALGRAGIALREDKVSIAFNGVEVVRNGLDTGKETQAAAAIKTRDVAVAIDLKSGKGSAKLWTTDLSYEYVKINSAYRT
ncbi:MAG: bifunctional glutamate N-acetyltransferase/amino-acid acetyltransferase ArgJ [Deltaproteobacteria bacterium]|nr:bifunctional glutamate N-acetyltransferase/amino-acid acetyltransferase ArgJ [Deltaproteobacteria bacterium]